MRESNPPLLLSSGPPEMDVSAFAGDVAAAGRTMRALLVFRPNDAGAAEALRGVAHYQQAHGGRSGLAEDQLMTEGQWRERLAEGWDGVISQNTSAALVGVCAALGVPLVSLDESLDHPGVSRVRSDNVAAGAMGAESFLERGFRSFGFVGPESTARACERRAGFVEAVRLGGHEAVVLAVDNWEARAPAGGAPWARVLERWLRELPKPAGVMACDDAGATRVLEAARAAGCLVPEEVAVLGAGNDVVRCELATPTLSSVDPGCFQLGRRAAEHLAQRLAAGGAGACDLQCDPAGVVARRSTDVLAIPDRAVVAALRYIAEHACEGLTVNEVLPHAAVSRSQLEKKFRQYLGRSPQAEMRRVQVARIRRLLAETDLPLKGIAGITGFDYMEYMCVVFRRLTGETPGAYRRRCAPAGRPAKGPAKSASILI